MALSTNDLEKLWNKKELSEHLRIGFFDGSIRTGVTPAYGEHISRESGGIIWADLVKGVFVSNISGEAGYNFTQTSSREFTCGTRAKTELYDTDRESGYRIR